jgi:hypothetical protein
MKLDRCTASDAAASLTFFAGSITASAVSRMLTGEVVRFGVVGHTSRGPLRILDPNALTWPEDQTAVKLTREHDRATSRGYLANRIVNAERIVAAMKVADGPEGDAAIAEADGHIRDGFSLDIVEATIRGDVITSGRVVAIGQVGIPAWSDSRIESIAASQTPAAPTHQGEPMTPEQRARLAALRAQTTRTAEEEAEYQGLVTQAVDQAASATEPPAAPAAPAAAPAAPAPVASGPAVPAGPATAQAGVPVAASMQTQVSEPGGLQTFAEVVAALMHPNHNGMSMTDITAALADVTHAQHTDNIEPLSWSGELWSGLEYQAQFMDLFSQGPLTNYEGKGWRWGVKPQVGDYAGNKAEIPTNTPTTIPSSYEAFRLAGGWDIDRKFFDFPNAAFIASFLAAARESYTMKLDFKVRDWMVANAVLPGSPPGTPVTPSQTSILRAVRIATKHVKRNTKGQAASWVYLNDDDMDQLFDVTDDDVPAFLELFSIDPKNFRSSADLAAGFVYAGAKQAATVRQLPGASPLRVEVQNLTKAGIDEAIFGYGAIEEHHETAIVKVPFADA